MKQKLRKPVAWLLTMAMVLGMIPDLGLTALASESDNLCLHHTEHTADCGYAEAAEARPCTHTHDESCGFTEGAEVVPCACEATDENGAIVHTEGCGYVAAIPAADCTHEHDDTCGYAEAVMAHECHYICTECLADAVTEGEDTTEPSAEIEDAAECTCDSDDPDWHAPFCALYEMPEEPECFCTELCDPELPNEWCDVCYFDADACAGSDEIEAVGYATTPTYIASLGIAQDAHEGDAKGELSGHTVIDYDLNKGCGSSSDYIYMGYKTTTDPGNAITGIFIRTGENPPASATFDGVTAYLVGGSYEANTAVDNVVDLNEDAGGAYIYVYVTRDTSRAPVTEITFSSSGSKSGYTTPNVDLNQGVGGSDDIYLHYKQFSATVNATYHYLTSTGSRTSSSQSGTVKHHEEKMTKVPSVSSTITYNGKSYAFKGWREDNTAAAASTTSPSVTYMTTPKTYRAVYSRTLTLRYDANGGTGAPTAQTATQYLNAGSSSVSEQSNSFTLSKTAPTHAGKCRFLGWSKNSDAASASYTAGSSISLSTDTTLYAVYQQEHSYTNGECVCGANIHSYDAKGFCACTAGETHYQPAVLKNGYYQIGNAGQLFWFANYINTVDRTANAILTDDIDLENRPWTPIGSTGESSNNFRGHFDGDGHTIKGLYVDVDRAGAGFFGEVRTGTVENFTIYGEVVANTEVDYVGGVIGSACGLNSSDHGLERNGAIIRNITSYVNLTAGAHGVGKIGGFVGYANHESLIENCAWYGTFDAGIYRVDNGAGGFIGRIQENSSEVTIRNCGAYGTIKTNYAGNYNNTATIYMGGFLSFSNTNAQTTLENCLFAGKFEKGSNLTDQAYLGAFGTLRGVKSIRNCYYLGDDGLLAQHSDSPLKAGDANVSITTVTAAQLKSGEVAYKLGDAFGQTIGTEDYPVLGGKTVYQNKDCAGVISYSNIQIEGATHDFDDNGFCTNCGGFEPAEQNSDGVYGIQSAGQLYWFAAQVNGGNTGINGKLTRDITVNANVLDANGELNSGNFRAWTPIGNSGKQYSGTFDGNGKTVSGLYYNNGAYGPANRTIGLFGVLNGAAVQDVSVSDSYLYGFQEVGGIAGVIAGSSTITGCTNSATVGGSDVYVGGIVGSAGAGNSSITDCTNTGSITGVNNNVGGIAGSFSSTGRIANCTNTGSVSGTGSRVGGIAGYFDSGTVENCYNTGSVGDVRNEWVGGIAGHIGGSGIVNNCYNIGAVSGSSKVGGVVGYNLNGTITICYYLNTAASGGINGADAEGQAEAKTTEAFASGEVAYLLGDAFGQTIGTDAYPNFTGAKVYRNNDCAGAIVGYSNTDMVIHGDFENGFCSVCGSYEAAVLNADGVYEISNAGQLYWFAAQVNGGDNAINGKLMENITVNENVLTENGELNSSKNFRAWTPIGSGKAYTGNTRNNSAVFDGNGKTVSGLYFNDSTTDKVGLFGGVGQYGTVKNVGVVDSWFCGKEYVGGIAGDNLGYIENCYNTGAVSGGNRIGGIAGDNNGYIENCYNTGAVSGGNRIGGIAGHVGMSSIVNNCYNIGSVSGSSNVGGIAGENAALSYVYNCYYLDTCGATGAGTVKTAEAFASGEVAYLLQGEQTEPVWGQNLDGEGEKDAYPVLGGAQVYYGYGSCADTEIGYTNKPNASETKPDHEHDPVTGKCANCDDIKLIEYDLWVGETQVTSRNLIISGTTGTVTYDPGTNTLTLNNYSYTGIGTEFFDSRSYMDCTATIYAEIPLTIILTGSNSLTNTTGDGDGIATIKNLTIDGDGTLEISAKYNGIHAVYDRTNPGDVVINHAAVEISAGNNGIYAYCAGVTMDGSHVQITSDYAGVYAYRDDVVIRNATVDITAGIQSEDPGIWTAVGGNISIESGDVTVRAGAEALYAATGDISIAEDLTVYDEDGKAIAEPDYSALAFVHIKEGPRTYPVVVTTTDYGTVSGAGAYAEGDTVTLTVTPDEGYALESLTVDGTDVTTAVKNNTYTFTMPAKAVAVTATFEQVTPYNLLVGGTQVTSANADDVFGDGKVSYDPIKNILTLNNYSCSGLSDYSAVIYYDDSGTLELVLNGENTIQGADQYLHSYGIQAEGGSIKISGDGKLTAIGGNATVGDSYGVYAKNGSIEISGGTVEATGSDAGNNSQGIYAEGSITITGGSLKAIAGEAGNRSCGVYAKDSIEISGGTVEATGGAATDDSSYGMYANNGSIKVSGGTVEATGGDVSSVYGGSYGVYARNDITVENGSLTATSGAATDGSSYGVSAAYGSIKVSGTGSLIGTGGAATGEYSYSYGVYAREAITVENGSLSGNGGTATGESGNSYGVSAETGTIEVSGGTVEATGSNASDNSCGVYAYYDITVTGGSLSGTGGTATGDSGFSYGIYADNGSITISGTGSLSGTGGEAPSGQSCSYGIYVSGGDLTISGSTVTANGGSASGSSYGVCADSIEVTGGSLTGNSGAAGEFSYGVSAAYGSIKVMGGSLSGSGDEAGLSSHGVYANNGGIEVNGGSLSGSGDLYGVHAYNLTMGEGIGILTPMGGSFDAVQRAVVDADGKPAKEVKIAEKPATYYDLWVGGTQVTSHNAANVFGDGKVSYNSETNTLTLDGYTYEGAGHTWEEAGWDGTPIHYGAAIYYGGNDTLELVQVNNNSITHTGGTTEYSSGIYADNGSITISGSGSLTATGGETNNGFSIGIVAKHIIVWSGTVTAVGNKSSGGSCSGIETMEGIWVYDGTVTATGGSAPDGTSYGVRCDQGEVNVSGGSLTAIGGITNDCDNYGNYGIYAGTIKISGGTVEAIGGEAKFYSCGADASYGITVSGSGSLKATGGTAKYYSYGIASNGMFDGHITINGGTVEATGHISACNMVPVIGNALAVYDADDQVIESPVWTGEGALTYAKIKEKSTHVHVFDADFKCTCGYDGIVLRGTTLSLEGNIGLNFYFRIDEQILEEQDVKVEIVLEDGRRFSFAENQLTTETVNDELLYKVTAEVYAKQMADSVTAKVYVGETKVRGDYTYSIRSYAEAILKNPYTYGEKMVALAKAMLNYGAAAQVNFQYNTGNPANSVGDLMTEAEKIAYKSVADDIFGDPFKPAFIEGIGGFAGANLVLESETKMNLYFQTIEGVDIADLTFTVDGKAVKPVAASGYHMISIPNIISSDLDREYEITVSNGTTGGTIHISTFNYAATVMPLPSEGTPYTAEVKDVLRAMYLYNQAANAYFETEGSAQ